MLATRATPRTVPVAWPVEPKLDGVRCLAVLDPAHGVTLWSRNRREVTQTYLELAEALARRARAFGVLDGEIVAAGRGGGGFARLQARMHVRDARAARATGVPVEYWVFDVPWWDGDDLRARPWRERRAALAGVVRWGAPLVLVPSWSRGRDGRLARLCAAGGEGLIAKRPDAPYAAGRSRDWAKLKCVRDQEFVVGGWTDPAGSRAELGALLVGYYEGGRLRYAGKVGTGFTDASLAEIARLLAPLARPRPPFDEVPPVARAHWVAPKLVVQVGFGEWTGDGRLRHPRLLGLRRDKRPGEVVRES
jgi:DNA ligase D-like protein (predicted ligase)